MQKHFSPGQVKVSSVVTAALMGGSCDDGRRIVEVEAAGRRGWYIPLPEIWLAAGRKCLETWFTMAQNRGRIVMP